MPSCCVSTLAPAASAYPPSGSAGSLGSTVPGAVADSAGSAAATVPVGLGLGFADAKPTTDPYDTAASAMTAGTVKNATLLLNLIISLDLLSGVWPGISAHLPRR